MNDLKKFSKEYILSAHVQKLQAQLATIRVERAFILWRQPLTPLCTATTISMWCYHRVPLFHIGTPPLSAYSVLLHHSLTCCCSHSVHVRTLPRVVFSRSPLTRHSTRSPRSQRPAAFFHSLSVLSVVEGYEPGFI